MTFTHEIALRKALRERLLQSAQLSALLGGQRVFDEPPRNAPTPYIVFARSQARDWSTMTERGVEHMLWLDVWTQRASVREALEIASLAAAALHDAALTIPGAACVLVRVLDTDTARESANRFVRCRMRVRALVEAS